MKAASSAEPEIARHLGARQFDGDAAVPYYERLLFQPSFAINHLSAGRPGNQIPHTAEALLEVRLVTAQDPQRVFAAFQRHVAARMPEAELTLLDGVPAARMDPRDPVVSAGIAAMRRAAGGELLVYPTLGGTLPLLRDFEAAGFRYIGLPLVNFDNNQHVANENVRVAALPEGILFVQRLLDALASP
jgi:acetylornithine deacetylase/succinyl-diaminopimelate desuccinylase-like protein